MQYAPTSAIQPQPSRGGGRIASPAYRQSLTLCEGFEGLEENTDRYRLLLLVKQVGKAAGFTPRMVQLLDYYLAFTRDCDWEEGSRPIVYQSLSRTALDLGVSERQIQKLEQQLFAVGAISWNDSGNHRRYGQRDAETGRILYAFGVDLTPLAYLQAELKSKLQEKRLYDSAWMETKRQISWYRRQIRSLILEREREEGTFECDEQEPTKLNELLAIQLRTHLNLGELRSLLERHKQFHSGLLAQAPTATNIANNKKPSRQGEQNFVLQTTTQESSDESDSSPADNRWQKSVAEPPGPTGVIRSSGIEHIALKHVLLAASDRFREHLPVEPRPLNWADVVEGAARLRPHLRISQASWGEACEILGRAGAAVCLLLTDQAALRSQTPALRPPAYFRGMVNKARRGELRLHNSIYGLIERNGASLAANAAGPEQGQSVAASMPAARGRRGSASC